MLTAMEMLAGNSLFEYTVKPPNKGHIGDRPVVPCREVVLFSEVFYWKFLLKTKNNT